MRSPSSIRRRNETLSVKRPRIGTLPRTCRSWRMRGSRGRLAGWDSGQEDRSSVGIFQGSRRIVNENSWNSRRTMPFPGFERIPAPGEFGFSRTDCRNRCEFLMYFADCAESSALQTEVWRLLQTERRAPVATCWSELDEFRTERVSTKRQSRGRCIAERKPRSGGSPRALPRGIPIDDRDHPE